MLRRDFVVLISRVLVQYVPELKPFGHVVPMHIPHEMSAAMSKMSETVSILLELNTVRCHGNRVQIYIFVHMQVPLGVITENEQEMEGMIEILTRLQQYVPKKESGDPLEIFLTGDQLTCERVRGAKRARMQSDDPQEQFATMIEMPGDWHALVTFYQVRLHVYTR